MTRFFGLIMFSVALMACNNTPKEDSHDHEHDHSDSTETHSHSGNEGSELQDDLTYPEETHIKNLRQLTFGGDNAEAYWSFDNTKLVFQRTKPDEGYECDQIFWGDVPAEGEDFNFNLVSTGQGRTTCSYFMKGNETFIYASTHASAEACPHVPESSMGNYVWPIYPEYELYVGDLEGNLVQQLTDNEFYDAEATVSPDGSRIVFTSNRSGDLELWTMNADGSDLKQITDELGYDGGAFFSPDGSMLVWRSSRPQSEAEISKYKELLAQNQVTPSAMEIYVANADGSNIRQVTDLGGANWAPFFHPSGEKILFCSNHKSGGFPFNLFMINLDGTGLEQITHDNAFDSFPMFSYDGKYLVFSSNRNNGGTRDTNLFIAEWED